jgi:hypothetical protein
MRKAVPPNVEPLDGRETRSPGDHDPTEVRGWKWNDGTLRPLLVAFLALVLVGMVLLAVEADQRDHRANLADSIVR